MTGSRQFRMNALFLAALVAAAISITGDAASQRREFVVTVMQAQNEFDLQGARDRRDPCAPKFHGDDTDDDANDNRDDAFDSAKGRRPRTKRCPPTPSSAGVSRPDFNADGRTDIVVGVPNEGIGASATAGSVNLLLRASGTSVLDGYSAFIISQDTSNVLDASEPADRFGAAAAPGDFNGDGFSDLAVAVPGEVSIRAGGGTTQGAVQVFHSAGAVLNPANDRFFNAGSFPVSGSFQLQSLGDSLAWGDFDGDGFGDLAIEFAGSAATAGVVVVFGGLADPLTGRLDGLNANEREIRIFLGLERFVLAAGDFNGDGRDDLAVGSPFESVGGFDLAGRVAVTLGSSDRSLMFATVTVVDRGTAAAFGNNFGQALAAGDLNDDGFDDLAVGEPGFDFFARENVGRVSIFYGDVNGIDTATPQSLTQGSAGGVAAIEEGDFFGLTLAAADFDADSLDDLAVGAPFEDDGGVEDAGAVNVFYGASPRLSPARAQFWTRASAGILGALGAGDRFGGALSAWAGQLNIGAPRDNINNTAGVSIADAGALHVIFGGFGGVPELNPTGNKLLSQQSLFGAAEMEANDRFALVIY